MTQVLLVYLGICFLGFCVYHVVNFILWCIGGIEESENEE